MASSMEEVLAMFAADCAARLDELEAGLLGLERDGDCTQPLNAAFRAIHTVKGNAIVVQQGEIEWFSHITESVMARLRDGLLHVDAELVSVLLACCDHLRFLLSQVNAEQASGPGFAEADRAQLIGLLVPYLGDTDAAAGMQSPRHAAQTHEDAGQYWQLHLKFQSRVLLRGMDPLDFLRHLTHVGRIVSLTARDDALPAPEDYDPEACYLSFDVLLDSTADRQAIEDVFALVRDECDLRITPPAANINSYVGRIQSIPEDLHTGEMLMRAGAITPTELAHGLRVQRQDETARRPIGDILINEGVVAPEVIKAVLVRQDQIRETMLREHHTLRIPVPQLDQLAASMDCILSTLTSLMQRGTPIATVELVALRHALEKSRQQAEYLRTTRFSEQFRRLHRMVRDASQELGKPTDLMVSGGEISLDRSVAELLGDVLLHLLRNAIDHGLETPVQRARAGKPKQGTLTVKAIDEGRWLKFSVADDGAGIDFARVRAVAIERGMLAADDKLPAERLCGFLFEPGFSTAPAVNHYSGRGVGLDAVREAIHTLNGEISLSSRVGEGTCFEIRLPRAQDSARTAEAHGAISSVAA